MFDNPCKSHSFQHIIFMISYRPDLCRMGQLMDLLQLPDGDLSIDLGGIDGGMAQQLLDVSDVCTILQHQSGTGMPEQVAGP